MSWIDKALSLKKNRDVVYRYVVNGYTNLEIADLMNINLSGVTHHTKLLFELFDVKSRARLIVGHYINNVHLDSRFARKYQDDSLAQL